MRRDAPLRAGLRFDVLARDGFACRYCGRCAPEVRLHVDHVHPRSRGGSDELDNLVTACERCNLGKGAKVIPSPATAPVSHERLRRATLAVLELWDLEFEHEHVKPQGLAFESVARILRAMPRGAIERNIVEAIAASVGADHVEMSARHRYFYGVCWSMIRERRSDHART